MSTDVQIFLTAAAAGVVAGSAIEQDGDGTRGRVLDAAVTEAAAQGLHGLTMDRVSRRAGVNRATVYRYFGDRDGLLEALALREGWRIAARIAEAAGSITDPYLRFIEACSLALHLTHSHPIVQRTARMEPQALIDAGLAGDAGMLRIVAHIIAADLADAQTQGVAQHVDAELAGETVARLLASFILLPGGAINLDDEPAVRRYIEGTLAPMVLGPRPQQG
ncbi:TetR/AcrR family transcriptional regulator [Nocardia sp. CA-128927]|uniref:TetR/AcrR family transcriptional regulator n=1 Tax=Nocardia sp. CA-128927 TaxID=3239975 RepID=UPI003D977F6C